MLVRDHFFFFNVQQNRVLCVGLKIYFFRPMGSLD
jgi:hypothetical protein